MDFPIELIKFASRGGGGATDAVKYTEQNLTEEQKMQARENQGLYYEKSESIVVEWDGDTTGRATFGVAGTSFYKVSDNVLSVSDFANATSTTSDGESSKIPPEYIQEMADGLVAGGFYIVSARAGVYDIGISITVPEDGVYFTIVGGVYVTRLEVAHETIDKIDPKFMPNTVALKTEMIKTYKFTGSSIPWDRFNEAMTEFMNGKAIVVWQQDRFTEAHRVSSSNDIYFHYTRDPQISYKATEGVDVDGQSIEPIGANELIIRSTWNDKYYRLDVDADGELKVIETYV